MIIDVQHLSYRYSGSQRQALRDLSFSVHPGEIFGFLGPSGAGKSTAQRVLTGLLQPYEGQVTVLDRDLRQWGPGYYERIGVSFEHPNHFSRLTARENLSYFAALYSGPTRSPQELLALVGLEDAAEMLVGQFSKGMKNRLTLVRALRHDPDVLFLDEPTAGLDPANARRVQELILARQATGNTIFLTTHDMTVVEALCDRVAFIVDGQIRLIDAPQQLKLSHGARTVAVRYQENGAPVERRFPLSGLGHNEQFLALLRKHPVETIHSQEASLDDIFISVTGRELE